ncbi:MAG: acyl-ACP--UDP-N-acetylglucosamine O-acyltransferase [candidate division Zixibacteria bacterium]|nr:acyl-ACP--UDP-N-acetylglucosamine O-acyltransferase [candidate division Zixibacteria bacterium]
MESVVPETRIHPTAIVDRSARLDVGVSIGPYAVIDGDVEIGSGSVIGIHAHVAPGARLGRNVRVFDGAAVGNPPQDLKFGGERTELLVGDRTVIREFATLNRGTSASGRTIVGADCLIMAYAHVAHDNVLGDHVILANAVQLGGHVSLGDWAIIGGGTVVHQFCKVGAHVMVGGGFRVTQDVVPYVIVGGYPLKTLSLNRVGLERRGFAEEQIAAMSQAFRIVFRAGLNMSQSLERLRTDCPDTPETRHLIEFISGAERGIIR